MMDVTTILFILLLGSLFTYISGDKLASKVAFAFGLLALGTTLYTISLYAVSYTHLTLPTNREV